MCVCPVSQESVLQVRAAGLQLSELFLFSELFVPSLIGEGRSLEMVKEKRIS
jgi:hypothetical protein